jgi:thiol-disulfide isomerase/thioredoxin
VNALAITVGPIVVSTQWVVVLISVIVAAVVGRYVGRRQMTNKPATTEGGSPETSRGPLLAALLAGALTWTVSTAILRLGDGPTLSGLDDIPFTTLQEKPETLASLAQGKPLVVNLWATWCPPCRSEMPVLAQAQERVSGVNFSFANQGEYAPTVQKYLAASQLSLANVLLDPGKKLGQQLGSMALPTTLFFDASGRLVDTHIGALSSASLADKLNKLQTASPSGTGVSAK